MKDEFAFIRSIQPGSHHQPTVVAGIGDDAALYDSEDGWHEIATVDTLVEDIHFSKKTMTAYQTGHRALAVNISDIAAMGGRPVFYLVAITVPKSGTWTEDELGDIYRGMGDLAAKYRMDLIGGDTNSTHDKLVVSVTVIGRVEKGVKLLRTNARPGDSVFVTGPVGSSAAGLDLLLNKGLEAGKENKWAAAHQTPMPQVQAGRIIAEAGLRTALNDISDGLASEAHEIAEASGVTIELEWERIPHELDGEERQKEWALFGGEDFQLIGCAGKEDAKKLRQLFEKDGLPFYKIGTVTEGSGVWLTEQGERTRLDKGGYNHFT
ncbi:thiamine-phosphate kinase [Alteribacter natronophilus]|uniref:thiamine-phosphate kinase n=1 Tax=Alteribacter natronophilus TaxID=2583810 RepID=UPI00110DBACD|nr:thiamine-phosphate kinase [Alteribacter natronophilus]TMW70872.1 thiamine-phosphate kinase [Alteribacter natronophilus]